VNVSVDTLDRQRFQELTRRDGSPTSWPVSGPCEHAAEPIKVNAVLMRGSNLPEAPALLGWRCARLPDAFHRAHAAGRSARVVARRDGDRDEMLAC